MALDFPAAPSNGQVYNPGPPASGSWIWDGAKWQNASNANNFLQLSGGTMTGPLVLSGNAASALQAVPLQQLNTVIAGYLPLTGGTLASPGTLTVRGDLHIGSGVDWYFKNDGNSLIWVANGTYRCWYDNSSNGFNVTNVLSVSGCQIYKAGDGWLYSATAFRANDIQSQNNVNATTYLIVNGIYIQNNAGWLYTGSSIQSNGDIQANSRLIANGKIWSNNANWMYTDSWLRSPHIKSDGDLEIAGSCYVNGLQTYNNGGWYYFVDGIHANQLYSRNDSWCAGNMTCTNLTANNDARCSGVFRCSARRGAKIEDYAGSSWDWMAFTMISGGYLGASPDYSSGFNYSPYSSWSDRRLKIDIRDTEVDALAAVLAIPIRSFSWNEEGRRKMPSLPEDIRVGVIAQEVEQAMPEVVHTIPEIDDMLAIHYDLITPYVLRAIQQLTARVVELEAKL